MPIGCLSFASVIAAELGKQQPKSVLDLGCGFGFYGALVRQWLDHGVRPWKTNLAGVDGFAPYRNPAWQLYDDVTVTTIESFLATDGREWDAILLLDVLEHFETATGQIILASARERLAPAGKLYVGTPAVWMPQGAAYGNEMECHRSLWTARQLADLGFELLMDGRVDQFGHQMLLGRISGIAQAEASKPCKRRTPPTDIGLARPVQTSPPTVQDTRPSGR